MSTKTALVVVQSTGVVIPVLFLLRERKVSDTVSEGLILAAVAVAFLGMAALFYALFREKVYGDRSEPVPRRMAITIVCVVCAWAVFCLYRGAPH